MTVSTLTLFILASLAGWIVLLTSSRRYGAAVTVRITIVYVIGVLAIGGVSSALGIF